MRTVPHCAHWQPFDDNALRGGIERVFEAIANATLVPPVWAQLFPSLARLCSALKGEWRWHVGAHQFRIDTTEGIARPTREGTHPDGVAFVAVRLVAGHGIKGGEA